MAQSTMPTRISALYKDVATHPDFKKLRSTTQYVFKMIRKTIGAVGGSQERENNKWVRELWLGLFEKTGPFAREVSEYKPDQAPPERKRQPRHRLPDDIVLPPKPTAAPAGKRHQRTDFSDYSDTDNYSEDDRSDDGEYNYGDKRRTPARRPSKRATQEDRYRL